jgi:hypothetical protein
VTWSVQVSDSRGVVTRAPVRADGY